ncbi:hypothetical protein, variant [Capsaspora owczarzaki ATCC 30864]|uniref:J domain-containing protein n=1 Tax=Capsaspora owczarzaki (strain ATCC 30864) TaxID=595528 RepID=A0A0D2VGQ2_CAPO3|nr:hypothetical protein, variant [Capsaspora owczarzaki ATCC 30864]
MTSRASLTRLTDSMHSTDVLFGLLCDALLCGDADRCVSVPLLLAFSNSAASKKSINIKLLSIVIGGWVAFWVLFYWASVTVEPLWDPYEILGISHGASEKEIKAKYRDLSRKYHPDRNPGNDVASELFIKIAKAHDALTDPETRRNWELYNNPDGPRAISAGFALPRLEKWQLSIIVLIVAFGLYKAVSYLRRNRAFDGSVKAYAAFYKQIPIDASMEDVLEQYGNAPEFNEGLSSNRADIDSLRQQLQAEHRVFLKATATPALVLLWSHLRRVQLSDGMAKDRTIVLGRVHKLHRAMLGIAANATIVDWAQCEDDAERGDLSLVLTNLMVRQCVVQASWPRGGLPLAAPAESTAVVSASDDFVEGAVAELLQTPGLVTADALPLVRRKSPVYSLATLGAALEHESSHSLLPLLTAEKRLAVSAFFAALRYPYFELRVVPVMHYFVLEIDFSVVSAAEYIRRTTGKLKIEAADPSKKDKKQYKQSRIRSKVVTAAVGQESDSGSDDEDLPKDKADAEKPKEKEAKDAEKTEKAETEPVDEAISAPFMPAPIEEPCWYLMIAPPRRHGNTVTQTDALQWYKLGCVVSILKSEKRTVKIAFPFADNPGEYALTVRVESENYYHVSHEATAKFHQVGFRPKAREQQQAQVAGGKQQVSRKQRLQQRLQQQQTSRGRGAPADNSGSEDDEPGPSSSSSGSSGSQARRRVRYVAHKPPSALKSS